MDKKNLFIGFVIGAFIGVLSIPVAQNLELPRGLANLVRTFQILSPFLAVIGLLIAAYLNRWLRVLWQVAKFILVGALNTFVDFAVLNVLISLSGFSSGLAFSAFKGVSFTVAVINSFLWNKYWTFAASTEASLAQSNSGRESEQREKSKEFLEFLLVSIIGLGINVATASFIVNVVGPQGGVLPVPWANLGAFLATVLSLTWNFLGYKFIVFRR